MQAWGTMVYLVYSASELRVLRLNLANQNSGWKDEPDEDTSLHYRSDYGFYGHFNPDLILGPGVKWANGRTADHVMGGTATSKLQELQMECLKVRASCMINLLKKQNDLKTLVLRSVVLLGRMELAQILQWIRKDLALDHLVLSDVSIDADVECLDDEDADAARERFCQWSECGCKSVAEVVLYGHDDIQRGIDELVTAKRMYCYSR